MGKRGPAGKAPDEKRLEGNPGQRRIPVDVFTPEGAPFVPDHLSEDATACAEHILRCFKTKRITAPDSYALAAFATAWAWHKAATHEMNSPDFAPLIDGSTGQKVMSPWFKILNDQAGVMLRYAGRLYLTPADRASIAGVGEEKPRSKFDGLIEQSGSSRSLSS